MDLRQAVLTDSVARGDVPFVVAMTAERTGALWSGAAGFSAEGHAAGCETVFRLFSMTKVVCAVAAALLADRGALDIDAPVTRYCPEFSQLKVLASWNRDAPILREPRRTATVRQLATHTAGLAYTHWNADMQRYRRATGLPAMASGSRTTLFYPLIADPGTCWAYGMGIDWLGLVVEAASGRSIEAFCADEIFGPLGMISTGFTPGAGIADAFARTADGGLAPFDIAPPANPEFRGMGDALYGTPKDFMALLRMILCGGSHDCVRLLSESAALALISNQIEDLRAGPMVSTSARVSADVDIPPRIPRSHSLIGQRTEADTPGKRRSGANGWAGILNTHWWLDPAAGRVAVFMTQVLPFADLRVMASHDEFERAVYA